jgi:oxaloacetate decarboxylase alpha subunit
MISNLRHQLRTMGMADRLPEILEEAGRVRAEFGYPIMVTPLAQFVGSQAAINIITGGRYAEVTDQSIQYALGHWGKEAPQVMDANVKDKILNRPRAKEWQKWSPPDPSLHDVRRNFGGAGVSDEELVLRRDCRRSWGQRYARRRRTQKIFQRASAACSPDRRAGRAQRLQSSLR